MGVGVGAGVGEGVGAGVGVGVGAGVVARVVVVMVVVVVVVVVVVGAGVGAGVGARVGASVGIWVVHPMPFSLQQYSFFASDQSPPVSSQLYGADVVATLVLHPMPFSSQQYSFFERDQSPFVSSQLYCGDVVCSSFPIGGVGTTMLMSVVVVVSELIIGIISQSTIKKIGAKTMQKQAKLDLTFVGTVTMSNSPAPLPTNL
mmetsp:Transcript_55055/g.124471  ORF Transcript_55055/g.124471 Transcript_55055/m.124471 type:complete len:202 (+) Transcript_55055:341-946(+)